VKTTRLNRTEASAVPKRLTGHFPVFATVIGKSSAAFVAKKEPDSASEQDGESAVFIRRRISRLENIP
jgi:hypothetical protein